MWRERVGVEPTGVVNASRSVLKTASSTGLPTVPECVYPFVLYGAGYTPVKRVLPLCMANVATLVHVPDE